jgi:RNA recognition motif-containing protein
MLALISHVVTVFMGGKYTPSCIVIFNEYYRFVWTLNEVETYNEMKPFHDFEIRFIMKPRRINVKLRQNSNRTHFVRFEVFTAVTMKNGVFWDVTPCYSSNNRHFGATWRLLHQGDKNLWISNNTSLLTRATRRNIPEDTILQDTFC